MASRVEYLQGSINGGTAVGALANGNGSPAASLLGSNLVEVLENAGGTATLNLEGSFDGNTWYALGYQQVDAILAPTRAIAAIAIASNAKHAYQILDTQYPQVRARLSAVAGGANVIVRLADGATS